MGSEAARPGARPGDPLCSKVTRYCGSLIVAKTQTHRRRRPAGGHAWQVERRFSEFDSLKDGLLSHTVPVATRTVCALLPGAALQSRPQTSKPYTCRPPAKVRPSVSHATRAPAQTTREVSECCRSLGLASRVRVRRPSAASLPVARTSLPQGVCSDTPTAGKTLMRSFDREFVEERRCAAPLLGRAAAWWHVATSPRRHGSGTS